MQLVHASTCSIVHASVCNIVHVVKGKYFINTIHVYSIVHM